MSQTPTFLVAVSGGDIYMGYSPNNLTLCTNGAAALVDTPIMDMQSGPPSHNDASATARVQRHMYFCDGTQYKRLNAHTGEVRAWEAYNGVDTLDSNVTVRGVMPFSADITTPITDQSGGQPVVAGDQTANFPDASEVVIQNASVTIDGSYTVASTSYAAGPDETTITLTVNPGLTATEIANNPSISHVTGRATIMALYRDRIVLALPHSDNWFMSASGDPLNWDYGPEVVTVTQAVAGSLSEVGRIGDIITALIPFSDDVLLIAGQHSLWVISGDPAAGGQIDNLSREIGVVGNEAWSFDSAGGCYILSDRGVYRIAADASSIEPISMGVLDATFPAVDYTENRAVLQWDRTREYLYVFLTNDTVGAANPTSYIYDARVKAFWPIDLPDENGPTAVTFFESPFENDRGVLLGGRDGYIRSLRDGRPNDNDGVDGLGYGIDVPIESYVALGPFAPYGPGRDWRVNEVILTLGGSSGNLDLRVYTGPTPEQAVLATTPRAVAPLSLTRSRYLRRRVAGQSLLFELRQNTLNTTWAYESGQISTQPMGKTRRPIR